MKIGARNRLRGTVQKVEKGIVTAKIKIKIGNPVVVTANILKKAIEELYIKYGDKVEAVIKATKVLVSKQGQTRALSRDVQSNN